MPKYFNNRFFVYITHKFECCLAKKSPKMGQNGLKFCLRGSERLKLGLKSPVFGKNYY